MVTFVVCLTLFMTSNCHMVIRGRHNLLYDLKRHGDHCGQFDLVYVLVSKTRWPPWPPIG